jgi:hypothetical protein
MSNQKTTSDFIFPTDLTALFFGIALFTLSIFANNDRLLSDPDTYLHIETGRWMWVERQFPRSEIFSHTVFGQPWINIYWLSQIILFFAYEYFGWHGVVIISSFIIAFTFVILYWLLARKMRATVALGVATVAFFFASLHFLARPHLFTYPIIVVWAAALAGASEENRLPSFWLLPLMTLWANLHGAFTLGLLLAAGFGLEASATAPAGRRWHIAIQWSIFWFCTLAAGLITPYGYHVLLETYAVIEFGPLLQQNGDWRAMNAYLDRYHAAILLALLILALTSGTKIRFTRALLLVGMLHMGLLHVRGLAMIALTWPSMMAGPLRTQFAFLRPATDPWPLFGTRRSGSLPAMAGITAVAVAMVILGTVHTRLLPVVVPSPNISPRAAVDYVLHEKVDGPVLNDFDFGGYLIFRGIKTFVDGRGLPFGKKFLADYYAASDLNKLEKLDEMANTYRVTWTLLRPNTSMAYYFDHSPRWRRLYADDIAVVHVRR